jgi:hypothetical protein
MQIKRIDIGSVLNKFDLTIDDQKTVTKSFGIRFVKPDGTIREIMHARKNVKNPSIIKSKDEKKTNRSMFNLKFHGTMLLYDDDEEAYKNVKVAHMFQFRDHRSNNWLDIFH